MGPRTPTTAYSILPGGQTVVLVASPAAGADWTYKLPGGYWYRLLAGSWTFTASAVAASRYVIARYTDGTNRLYEAGHTAAVAANLTYSFNVAPNPVLTVGGAGSQTLSTGLPAVWLEPGYTVGTRTVNIDTGDQYSAIVLMFERLDFDLTDQPNWEANHAKK